MGFDEWDSLAEMALATANETSTPLKRVYPGSIVVERLNRTVFLTRQIK
jgi:hypothetical protein